MNDAPVPQGGVVFVGASELGRDALSVVEGLRRAGRPVELKGFVDDSEALRGGAVSGYPVLGGVAELVAGEGELEGVAALITIGAPAPRERVARRLAEAGVAAVTLAHPTAVLGDSVEVGEGCLIMAGVTTTVDARLGSHVVVNPGCTLAHDVVVDDFAYLSPGVDLAGRVVVERGAYLGIGAVALPGVRIGAGATVGAGCVVIRDVEPGTTVVGVPGRPLEARESRKEGR